MVLNNVPKKNALDDIFWMTLYNMTAKNGPNNNEIFYNILIPFLTGKPLEATLLEAERASHERKLPEFGDWRFPQQSEIGHTKCIFEILFFMLRDRGFNAIDSERVFLAFYSELICMMKNDLACMIPDSSGVRVCSLALKEFSKAAVFYVDSLQESWYLIIIFTIFFLNKLIVECMH